MIETKDILIITSPDFLIQAPTKVILPSRLKEVVIELLGKAYIRKEDEDYNEASVVDAEDIRKAFEVILK